MKQTVKRIVDLAMIILLPLLMAEIIIGQEIHEWLGTAMLALFLIHHILNFGWWKSFYKGRYSPSRAFGTAIDLLLLFDMLALCISGIMMSGFVFRFLYISGGMILARQLHLFASYCFTFPKKTGQERGRYAFLRSPCRLTVYTLLSVSKLRIICFCKRIL